MLERVVPLMDHPSDAFLRSLDEALCALFIDGGMKIIASSLACTSAIYNKWKKRRPAVIDRFLNYLRYLNEAKDEFQRDPGQVIPHGKGPFIQRALYSVGLISRYFDVDEMLGDDESARLCLSAYCCPLRAGKESGISLDEQESEEFEGHVRRPQPFTDDIYAILTTFCRNRDGNIRTKALNALGNFTAAHPEFLTRLETRNMYLTLLAYDDKEYLNLKVQALLNLELFLAAEEMKLVKGNNEWHKAKDGHDLKEMELSCSGMGSSIIQIYWNAILNAYYNPIDAVRTAAVQVTLLTLNQGLVTPGSSIPTLIAMTTDCLPNVRNKVENVLRDIDSKYAGMVHSKAVAGIRCSFRLQCRIRKEQKTVVRGIRVCEQSVTNGRR
ncbi:hypothetical protein AB6A40_009820 [Gnathostoma spinigerum]|uniref:Nipped-B protein n=1 Tax=Gnathostoma spinigerum TaxID=75299 RepID=A0ABD6EZW5_9BILA